MKKIYIAYTGGTIGMKLSSSGLIPDAGFKKDLQNYFRNAQLIDIDIDIDIHVYSNLIDSSNITPLDWLIIARDISSKYQDYDGFIILHGTDTMAYTSSMLSFMLQKLNKPVVLTGSQIPLSQMRSDAVFNIEGALAVATSDKIKEVCLFFNGKIIRGNRAMKKSSYTFEAFNSPNYPLLAKADIQLKIYDEFLLKSVGEENFQLYSHTESNVAVIQLFPGITSQWVDVLLNQNFSAFIFRTYGEGNGPDLDASFIKVLEKHASDGKMMVNVSQCYQGTVSYPSYASGLALLKAGLIPGYDLTIEATFCKLHFLFSQSLAQKERQILWHSNIAGEVTESFFKKT